MESPSIEMTAHTLNLIKNECEQQKRGCKRKSSENSEYQCQQCPSAFVNTSNLRQHVESLHTRTQTWPCSQCGKMFTSKSNLKVHLRVHTRIRPYHCKHCVYSCMHHSSIKEHLLKVHVDIQHSVNSPGYVYNANAVPDPEDFNSKHFDKDAFIAEAKETNNRLSEQISNHMITPPSSASSTNADYQTPETKRQRLIKNRRNQQDQMDTTPIRTSQKSSNKNPFSIDSIINTPCTPKPITHQYLAQQPQTTVNAWLFALQLNQSMQTYNWYHSHAHAKI